MGHLSLHLCAIACITALPSTNALAACWQPLEVKAAEVRNLHTMLMVGAMRCKESDAGIADRYKEYVAHNQAALDTHNLVLKARFMREAGIASGQKAYDDYVTALADAHSARLADTKFCPMVDSVTRLVAEGSATDLETLATSLAADTVAAENICKPEAVAAEPAAEPALKPAIVTLPEKATETATPAAGVPPAMSQKEALQAAAAAIQSATAALQAVRSTPTEEPTPSSDPQTAEPTDSAASPAAEPKPELR